MKIDLENLYICNIIDKRSHKGFSEHCKLHCLHSKFHYKDFCTNEELCNMHKSEEIVKVRCRKIKKKELNKLQEIVDMGGNIIEYVYLI